VSVCLSVIHFAGKTSVNLISLDLFSMIYLRLNFCFFDFVDLETN